MTAQRERSHPRLLHPVAWWVWALALAAAASRTYNPFLLLLIGATVVWVVLERRENRDSRVLVGFLLLGAVTIVLRLAMTVILGGSVVGPTTVLSLPQIPLPDWAVGVRLGGDTSAEALVWSLYQGLQLAVILVCVGGANVLASPTRLLRYIPATLYDVGTSMVVGLTYAPALAGDVQRVARARQLRGHSGRGLREMAGIAVPVLAGALERSLQLAASMESRGYGRSAHRNPRRTRRASAVTIVGLIGVLAGTYGVLDGTTPPLLAMPLLLLGLALATGALLLGAGADRRTHHRHDPWGTPEWLVVSVGVLAAITLAIAAEQRWPGIVPPQMPLAVPALPLPAVLALVLSAAPGVLTPLPPSPRPRTPRARRSDSEVAA